MYLCNSVKTLTDITHVEESLIVLHIMKLTLPRLNKLFRFPNVLDAEASFNKSTNIKYMPMTF